MGSHIGDRSHRSILGYPLLEESLETAAEPATGEPHFAVDHCRRSLIRINRRRIQGLDPSVLKRGGRGEEISLTQVNARFRHNTYQ
jgi:hypothetical protein